MRKSMVSASVLLMLSMVSGSAVCQETDPETPDETKRIRAAVESYVAAYNARDVEKLVAHWSPDAVYISRDSGDALQGHEEMIAEFSAVFAEQSVPKLAVTTESIDFISPNVAVERGTALLSYGEKETSETRYRVVYIRRDGTWLIDRVTEDETAVDSHYDKLKELEWLVGDWYDEEEGFDVEISCSWTKNQNFISRTFVVSNDSEVESSGLQIIGWDAQKQQILSWLFDSDGSVVTGTWNKREDRWVVQSVASLADGGSGSFTSIYRPLEDGNLAWRKINRVLDGEILSNIDEIVLQRK